jgi:predicted nuclease of predicted toxin-antitoxin system
MKFLLDMNLTPRWREEFVRRGHVAVHWSEIGPPTAPDAVIMRWARENGHVVFTHDLDLGTVLALTHASGPSVIQVRAKEPIPEAVAIHVFWAIDTHADLLEQGALVTIDAVRSRVRLLPIRPAS